MIELSGIYQGKNMYVQNPVSANGVGFCVTGILINGIRSADSITSIGIEINLGVHGLRIGDAVKVVIQHKDGCKPKVLNPEVLSAKSTFDVEKIGVATQSGGGYFLQWETKNELGKLDYIIEQFRWNKWAHTETAKGLGTPARANYDVRVDLHSGENKLRIKQVDYTGMPRISNVVTCISVNPVITFSPVKADKEIVFSAYTFYEIFDQYGNKVKNGFDKIINIQPLPKGKYYLNYDNTSGEFVKTV